MVAVEVVVVGRTVVVVAAIVVVGRTVVVVAAIVVVGRTVVVVAAIVVVVVPAAATENVFAASFQCRSCDQSGRNTPILTV